MSTPPAKQEPPVNRMNRFNSHGLHHIGGQPSEQAQAHVVFVHGLGGSGGNTWAKNPDDADSFWPTWLVQDLAEQGVAVWTYGYDASSTVFKGKPEALLPSSLTFLRHLETDGLLTQPVALVMHSLGGLVSKALLRKLSDTKHAKLAAFRGLVFFGTPHLGSPVKSALTPLNAVASELGKVLDFSHPDLVGLNDWFRNHWPSDKALVFSETQPLAAGVTVVPQASADPGLPNSICYPLPAHHKNMCKLDDRSASVYRLVCQFLRQALLAPVEKLTPPTTPASIPHFINIRPSLGENFKGRDKELAQLHEALQAGAGQDVVLSTHALQGMGGYGKTRLAEEYARHYGQHYRPIALLNAESPDRLEASLSELCGKLHLGLADQPPARRADEATKWLAQHKGWLFIADNADTLDAARAVAELAKALPNGRILITTRLNTWGEGFVVQQLGKLTKVDARALLLAHTQQSEPTDVAERQALDSIVDALDGYALGLHMAAAYVHDRRISWARYHTAWQQSPSQMLGYNSELIGDYPRSVLASLRLSIDALSQDARALLERLAWLAPAPLPQHLLDAPLEGVPDTRAALAELRRYGLLEAGNDPQLHRVLIDVVRAQQRTALQPTPSSPSSAAPSATACPAWQHSLAWVNQAMQGNPSNVLTWPVLLPLVAHAENLLDEADQTQQTHGLPWLAQQAWAKTVARMLNQLGVVFYAQASFRKAEPLFRRALAIHEASCGKDQPEVARGLNNLATLLKVTNRSREAEQLLYRALAISETRYGKGHPEVATALHNLANVLYDTNRLDAAEPLCRRALAIDEANYGEDHPEVATDLNTLALLLFVPNRLGEAESLLRRALAIDKASYGEDHPDIARDLNNLAMLLAATGRLKEAEPLSRRHLEIFVQFTVSNGHAHPHLSDAIGHYAGLLQALGWSKEKIQQRMIEVLAPILQHPRAAELLQALKGK